MNTILKEVVLFNCLFFAWFSETAPSLNIINYKIVALKKKIKFLLKNFRLFLA